MFVILVTVPIIIYFGVDNFKSTMKYGILLFVEMEKEYSLFLDVRREKQC